MECEKNMTLVDQKIQAETPGDWREVIASAQVKRSSFRVVECTTEVFKTWGNALKGNYSKTFAAPTRLIRQLVLKTENT